MPADASASVYATTLSPRRMSQVSAAMWDIVSPPSSANTSPRRPGASGHQKTDGE